MSILAKITFCGGVGSVTGANFLLEVQDKKILIDCGLTQGTKLADDLNWEKFSYDPKEIDILFITHAHADHIGRIPKLIHDGFKGKIYSTNPTKDLSYPMLMDTAMILSKNQDFDLDIIYTETNIKKAMSLWEGFDYNNSVDVFENFSFSFLNAGHILGSAMVLFNINNKKILFTGDLGNSPSPILPDTEKISGIDYLVMESVYGDRNHESRDDRRRFLEEALEENYKRKGTLIIPTFSLERSQELLFELNDLVENEKIPHMPIFFDSPLAIRLTEVFKKYKDYLNDEAKKVMIHDKYIFDFSGLHTTLKSEESKMIFKVPNPKVIIAGSGMSSGGRIVYHEKHFLPDPNNMILLLGYQALGTPGRMIQEGLKKVNILGEEVSVRAKVKTIFGYSGHKDSDGLLNFVADSEETLKKVFVAMGEPKSSFFLAQKIQDNLGISAHVPERGDVYTIVC